MNTKTAAAYLPPAPAPKHIGYSVLRAGTAESTQLCVAAAHVDTPRSISLNEAAKRLEIDVGGARLLLAELPDDLIRAIKREPARVLLLTVDTLSRPRFSARASDLLASAQ